jgi:hypothetical protein
MVVTDLERVHPKEVEWIDYTSLENGEWGISSSDYDNYIATNAEYHQYDADMNEVLQLCIDGEKVIDVTGLGGSLYMGFDAWYEIEGYPWDYVLFEVAPAGADDFLDWTQVDFQFFWGNWPVLEWTSSYDGALEADDYWCRQSSGTGIYVDLFEPWGVAHPDEIEARFRFISDSGLNMRGAKLDNFDIPDLDFTDTCDNLDNWCQYPYTFGTFWSFDGMTHEWCWNAAVAAPYDDALIWSTEIMDAYEAYLSFEYLHVLNTGVCIVDVSADGGLTWYTICRFTGTNPLNPLYDVYHYDLTAFVGSEILVRFRV